MNKEDYYLNYNNCLNRLIKEYHKYGSLIVAYDFDNTVFDFHNEGHNYNQVITLLQNLKPYCKLICFTASEESRYSFIKQFLKDNDIPFDTINKSIEGTPKGNKVYYNILLDDRAGLGESYNLLQDLLKNTMLK